MNFDIAPYTSVNFFEENHFKVFVVREADIEQLHTLYIHFNSQSRNPKQLIGQSVVKLINDLEMPASVTPWHPIINVTLKSATRKKNADSPTKISVDVK